MKKKTIGLVALLLLLAALVVVYFLAVGKWGDDEPQPDPVDTGCTVYACDAGSIKGIRIENAEGSFSFSMSDTGWKNDGDEHFPVDDDAVDNVVSVLTELKATRKLEGDDIPPLSDVGLDAPALTVTVTQTDGTAHAFGYGSYNRHSGAYYLLSESDGGVYMVTSDYYECFVTQETDFLKNDSFPAVASANVTAVEAKGPDGTILLSRRSETVTAEDGTTSEQISFTHKNTKGEEVTLDEEAGMSVIGGFTSIGLRDCADYCADDEELRTFGLDEASRTTVTVRYTVTVTSASDSGATESSTKVEQTAVFHIAPAPEEPLAAETETSAETSAETEDGAADTADGSVYLTLDGSRMVYRVSLGTAAAFFS